MEARWKRCRIHLHDVLCIVLIFHLHMDGCLSVNIEGLALLEFRSKIVLDPHDTFKNWSPLDNVPCKWFGVYCVDGKVDMLDLNGLSLEGILAPELGELSHLRALFLQTRQQERRQSDIFVVLVKRNLMKLLDMFVMSKFWESSKNTNGHAHTLKGFSKTLIVSKDKHPHNSTRRILLQGARNLRAVIPISSSPIEDLDDNISSRTGSFLAVATSTGEKMPYLSTFLPHPTTLQDGSLTASPLMSGRSQDPWDSQSQSGKGNMTWIFIVVVLVGIILMIIASIFLIGGSRKKKNADLRKAGLSAKLQKALTKALTDGIPKLNREELELACEDFCNIVQSYPEYTVYKGTLCSGVEIAVLSTMTSSPKDWTKHMEAEFRKKIDSLSRVNHKNFINLLGCCDEEQPFVRMMVFEYAPSGTLTEHIHDKGFEHLDWGARMRIIMGIAYCLQYNHELSPPVVHPNLQSNSVFLTDDHAAKISEMDFWKYVVTNVKASGDETDGEDFHADPSSNVYDFGVLLLEIISGKETYSREEGSIVDWAADKLKDPGELHPLTDPMLKTFKTDQLAAIFEVIKDCVYQEPKKRPTMKDVATKLRQALMISPDSATPRLSPLWWAELEVLSMEAS